MKHTRNLLIILTILSSTAVTATQDSTETWSLTSFHWWKGVYSNGVYVIASPLRWDTKDWLTTAIVTGTCASIMGSDDQMQSWMQDKRGNTSDGISAVIRPLGGEGAVAIFGGLYLGGCIARNTAWKRTALLCCESVITSGIIVDVLKPLIGRSRPYQGQGSQDYHSPSIESGSHSFPSGHVTTAFSIASCLTEEYGNPWVAVGSYATAFLVAVSRVHDNKHWVSDVFAGSVLGISVGRTVVKLRRKKREKNSLNWRFVPGGFPTGDFTG
jgi:membrane-associated phospholipid phosphatase